MIRLTRLDGSKFVLNADLICYVETLPDTYVTLTTGERVTVQETIDEVIRRTMIYQQAKNLMPSPKNT